jgi:hypothetical protein
MTARMHLFFLFLFFIAQTEVAQAKLGFYPTKNSARPRTFSTETANKGSKPKLKYYGGPVVSNPKVYVVFWDKNVDIRTQNGIRDFYAKLTNSTQMDWLSQYDTNITSMDGHPGTNQHIGRGEFAGAITLKPFNHGGAVDDSDIQVELQKQIDAGYLPKPDDNTMYMVYFPMGMRVFAFGMASCSDFCAYHSAKGTPETDHFVYGVMPDVGQLCGSGCQYGSDVFNSISAISSHEYTEAVTDPFPTPGNYPAYPQAWNDVEGSEIADICAGSNDLLKFGKNYYVIQSEWDNAANTCSDRKWYSP